MERQFTVYQGVFDKLLTLLCNALQICDRIKYPTVVSIIGNTCMAVAFFFMGPVPFVNIQTTVPLVQGTIGIVGFGYALVMVSTFGRAQGAALRKGFKDDIDTYLLISGM